MRISPYGNNPDNYKIEIEPHEWRTLLAACALGGMLASADTDGTFPEFAMDAVHYSDALLAALAKQPAQEKPE